MESKEDKGDILKGVRGVECGRFRERGGSTLLLHFVQLELQNIVLYVVYVCVRVCVCVCVCRCVCVCVCVCPGERM